MMSLELDVKTLSKVGSIHISRGNKKLSRKVGNFNLPACRTCPFQGICRDYCYAIKAEKWRFVTCSRWDNFWATRRASFVDEMVAKITKMGLKVIRVHESGDLYTPEYAEMWTEIARRLPDVRFYLYTKSIPYAAPLRDLPNFTVIFSYGGKMDDLITQGSDNYARVVDSAADVQPGEHFCRARTPGTKESQKICGRTCTYCHGEGHQVRVCFLIHEKGKNWKANTQRPPSKPSPSKSALATTPPAVSMAATAVASLKKEIEAEDKATIVDVSTTSNSDAVAPFCLSPQSRPDKVKVGEGTEQRRRELLTLKAMALTHLSIAQEILKQTGHIQPCVVVQKADGVLIYADLPNEKHLWRRFLSSLLRWECAQRYFIVSEAWACTLSRKGPGYHQRIQGLPTGENPLRYEIILVAAIERTGNHVLVEQQFARDPGGINLFRARVFTNAIRPITFPTGWGIDPQS